MNVSPETEMVAKVGSLWSAGRTQAALGLTEVEMAARRSAGTLLGVPTSDGQVFYPLAQFDADGDGGARVRPGLLPLLEALRETDPWTTAMLTVTAADELDGSSPVEWVRDGGDPEVLADYANVVRSECLLSRAGQDPRVGDKA